MRRGGREKFISVLIPWKSFFKILWELLTSNLKNAAGEYEVRSAQWYYFHFLQYYWIISWLIKDTTFKFPSGKFPESDFSMHTNVKLNYLDLLG